MIGDTRFEAYRNFIEGSFSPDRNPMPRGKHIGDEDWLQAAQPGELIKEAMLCVNERYYMEGVWENMHELIERFKIVKWRKTLGIDYVYQKPKKGDKETATVRYNGRGGRTGSWRGGRGGGNAGRGDGGSFRGWK